MLKSNRWMLAVGLLVVAGVIGACQPAAEPETIVQTVIVEGETIVVTVTPEPAVEEEKVLVVCQGQEPDTLNIHGGSMLAAAHIWQAIYGHSAWGGGDQRSYAYQPIILEKLPSLADGDAILQAATASEGDTVINNDGDPVELAVGETIRPAGCKSGDCAIEYTGGDVEMDQMAVTYQILPGILWSDGEPMTAFDSVYAWGVHEDPDTPATKFLHDRTISYEALDDLTNVWTGIPGYLDSTYFLNFHGPLPEHVYSQYTAAEQLEAEETSRTPMGIGPFIITEWVAGSHITTVKNPNYFRADEGLPKVDKVIFRFVGEEPNPVIAATVAGECDIMTQDTHADDQTDLIVQLEIEGEVTGHFVTGTVWEHVDFGIFPVESYVRPDFFSDVRFRQAFAQCLDRQSVIDAVLFGKSVILNSYIPEQHPLYNPDVKVWPYDVDAATALLEEVGWVDADGDGFREAAGVAGVPDGTALAFKWQSTTAELRVNYMQIFKEQVALCGIDLTIENLPAGEYFADGPEGPLFGRHFDVGSFAWLTGVEPPCDLYITSETPGPVEEGFSGWGALNDTGFSDAEYDIACLAAIQSLPGTPEYFENHLKAQLIWAEKLPVVPLFPRIKLAVTRPEVVGFIMDPTENSEMWNIEEFDLSN